MAFRNAARVSGSGERTAKSATCTGTGTSSASVTSWREMRTWSAKVIRVSRRLGCLISWARSSSVSRSPNSASSWAAVLMPMPGAPGTLSTLSPARAWTSTTFSGGTPNFSITWSRRIGACFTGSSRQICSLTSCIRSLSDETTTTSPPAAATWRA